MKKDSPQRKRVNAFLVKQMGESKGLWLKVGQMLSLHPESWEGLEAIPQSEEIPSISKEDFLPYLEGLFQESGFELQKCFPIISFPGLSASLSQVQEVFDQENHPWVIKAKLPGIYDIIFDQLSVLGFVKRLEGLQPDKKSFETTAYQKSIKESFERELDYDLERANLQSLSILSKRFSQAKVPGLHEKIQANDFIVMERVQGDNWQTVLESYSPTEKQQLGINLIEQFLYQYFCLGKAQGDFHPGNFFFQRNGTEVIVSWIDLGQCLTPTPVERKALFYAIRGLIKGENLAVGPLFSAWNFNLERLSPIANRLPLMLTKVFLPFTYPAAFDLKTWSLKKDLDKILGEDRWWFRTAGSPELFLSIRCWIGLFSMLETLDVPLHFKGIWLELEKEMEESLTSEPLPPSVLENVTFNDLAKSLKVQIYRDGNEKVFVTLPARAIEDIESFLSPETLLEMEKVKINLSDIISEQLKRGLIPGKVVDFSHENSRYLVTLE